MDKAGFLYISSGRKKFTLEAIRSARSLKTHCQDYPVVLLTDYIHEDFGEEYKVFNQVIIDQVLNAKNLDEKLDWGTNVFKKIFALKNSPFDKTVLLDTDTIIRSDEIKSVFKMLEEHELIITKASSKTSNSAKLLKEDIYYTGFLAFQSGSEKFKALVDRWVGTLQLHQSARDEKKNVKNNLFHEEITEEEINFLLSSNQVGLAAHLRPNFNPLGIKVKEVPVRRWNHHSPDEHADVIVDANPLNKFPNKTLNSYGHLSQFSSPISKTVMGLSLKEREELIKAVKRHVKGVTNNYSGTNGLRTEENIFEIGEPAFNQLKEKLEEHFISLFTETYFKRSDLKKKVSFHLHGWAYVLSSGGYISPHQHTSAMISGTYYASIPKQIGVDRKGGSIEIYNPNGAEGFTYRFGQVMNKIELFPQSDDLICFPSYLWHGVTPFPEEGERIGITFDLCEKT